MKIRDITAKYGVLNSAEEKRWVHSIRRVNGDDQIGMRFKVLSREGWKLYSEKLFERDWEIKWAKHGKNLPSKFDCPVQ